MNDRMAQVPLIPFTVIGVFVLLVFAGLIFTMRDQHARDSSFIHTIGVTLVGVGITGCLVVGTWNFMVSAAAYISHQQELAIIVPLDPHE